MNRRWKKKRVGLALGSGGARGWAHLGVLQALRELDVQVDLVAGTSMGALVGAFFAAGREAGLMDLARGMDLKRLRPFFWEVTLSRSGLTDGKRLLVELEKLLGVNSFKDLALPFRAVATELRSGAEVVLEKGDLLGAIRASISIPGLFSPVWIGSRLLVDGGLVNPVPVNVARAMGADRVIAVDISQGIRQEKSGLLGQLAEPMPDGDAPKLPRRQEGEEGGVRQMLESFYAEVERKARRLRESISRPSTRPLMTDVLMQTVRITEMQIALSRRAVEPPDILIEPRVGGIGTLEFHRAEPAIQAGYKATLAAFGG